MDRGDYPFDKLFRDHDSTHSGGLIFQDFIDMNEFIGVSIEKKDLHRVFSIIDKDKSGLIMMDEVRQIANSTWKEEAKTEENEDAWLEDDDEL